MGVSNYRGLICGVILYQIKRTYSLFEQQTLKSHSLKMTRRFSYGGKLRIKPPRSKFASIAAVCLSLALLSTTVAATQCFPKSEQGLPKVLMSQAPQSDEADQLYAVASASGFVITGGSIRSVTNTGGVAAPGLITRVNTDNHARAWAKVLRIDDPTEVEILVEALILTPDSSELVFYARGDRFDFQDARYGSATGYIGMLRTADGGYIRELTKISHDTDATASSWRTSDAGMVASGSKVYLAFEMVHEEGGGVPFTVQQGSSSNYQGYEARIRFAAFDTTTGEITAYQELTNYFGRATSAAFKGDKLWIGGAIDIGKRTKHNENPNWRLSLLQIDPASSFSLIQETNVQVGSSPIPSSSSTQFPTIHILRSVASHDGSDTVLFGATRGSAIDTNADFSYLFVQTGTGVGASIKVREWPSQVADETVRVVGVSDQLESSDTVLQFINHDETYSSGNVYYTELNIDTGAASFRVMTSQITRLSSAIFDFNAASATTFTGDASVSLYQVYQAGWTTALNGSTTRSNGNSIGVLLPTRDTDTCATQSATESTINYLEVTGSIVDVNTLLSEITIGNPTTGYDTATSQAVRVFDIAINGMQADTSLCSSFSTAVTDITAGHLLDGSGASTQAVCNFDMATTEHTFDFQLPVFTCAAGSGDTQSSLWTGYVSHVDGSSTEALDLKYAINTSTSELTVNTGGVTSLSSNYITLRAHFALPDAQESTFDFVLATGVTCSIAFATVADCEYNVGAASTECKAGAITTDCASGYTTVVEVVPSTQGQDTSWLTLLSDGGHNVGYTVQSTDNSMEGTYVVKVTASADCQVTSQTFRIVVCGLSCPCVITPGTSPSAPIQYTLGQASSALTSTQTLSFSLGSSCPSSTYVWQQSLDKSISSGTMAFQNLAYSSSATSVDLLVDLSDAADAIESASTPKTFALTVYVVDQDNSVNYDGAGFTMDFTIEVYDPCQDATFDLTNVLPMSDNILQSIVTAGSSVTFGSATVVLPDAWSSTSCPSIVLDVVMRDTGSSVPEVNSLGITITEDALVTGSAASLAHLYADNTDLNSIELYVRAKFDGASYTYTQDRELTIEITPDCSLYTASSSSPISDQSYTLMDSAFTFQGTAFTISPPPDPSVCSLTYTMEVTPLDDAFAADQSVSISPLPITFDAGTLTFTVFEDSNIQATRTDTVNGRVYDVSLKGSFTDSVDHSETFRLTVLNPCFSETLDTPSDFQSLVEAEYVIGDLQLALSLQTDYSASFGTLCGDIAFTTSGLEVPLTYDEATNSLQLQTTDSSHAGLSITVTATPHLVTYPDITGEAQVISVSILAAAEELVAEEEVAKEEVALEEVATEEAVTNEFVPVYTSDNKVPQLETSLPTDLSLNADSATALTQTVSLGKIIDQEGDPFIVKAGSMESFLTLTSQEDQLELEVDLENAVEGVYTVQFAIESTPAESGEAVSTAYSFPIVIEKTPSAKQEEIESDPDDEPTLEESESISEVQVLSRDEVLATLQASYEPPKPESTPPTFRISEINQFGQVTISFSEKIVNLAKPEELITNETLSVQLKPSNFAMSPMLGYEWEFSSLSATELKLMLNFENPHYVSTDNYGLEVLVVEVLLPELFTAQRTFKPLEKLTSSSYVPQQYAAQDEEAVTAMEEQAEQIQSGANVIAGSSAVINVVLASSLALLWGLINSLQIVAFCPEFNCVMPKNAQVYYDLAYHLATFKLIPTDDILIKVDPKIKIVELVDQDEIRRLLQESELDDSLGETDLGGSQPQEQEQETDELKSKSNFFQDNFKTFLVLFGFLATLLVLAILYVLFIWSPRVKGCVRNVWRKIFWNMILRSQLETCLEIFIACLLALRSLSFSDATSTFALTLTILQLSLVSLLIVVVPIMLHCKRDQLNTDEFKAKYGSLTLGMDVSKGGTKYLTSWFLIKRLGMAVLIVEFAHWPWFQLLIFTFLNSLTMTYTAYVQPYDEKYMNVLETHNEALVLLTCYFLLIYSDGLLLMRNPGYPEFDEGISDIETKTHLAWGNVAILGLIAFDNLLVILVLQVKSLYGKIRICFLKRKQKKLLALYLEKRRRQYLTEEQRQQMLEESRDLERLSGIRQTPLSKGNLQLQGQKSGLLGSKKFDKGLIEAKLKKNNHLHTIHEEDLSESLRSSQRSKSSKAPKKFKIGTIARRKLERQQMLLRQDQVSRSVDLNDDLTHVKEDQPVQQGEDSVVLDITNENGNQLLDAAQEAPFDSTKSIVDSPAVVEKTPISLAESIESVLNDKQSIGLIMEAERENQSIAGFAPSNLNLGSRNSKFNKGKMIRTVDAKVEVNSDLPLVTPQKASEPSLISEMSRSSSNPGVLSALSALRPLQPYEGRDLAELENQIRYGKAKTVSASKLLEPSAPIESSYSQIPHKPERRTGYSLEIFEEMEDERKAREDRQAREKMMKQIDLIQQEHDRNSQKDSTRP